MLVEVGNDHRLADPEPLRAMLEACERVLSGVLIRRIWKEVKQHPDLSSAAASIGLQGYLKACESISGTFNQIQQCGLEGLRAVLDTLLGIHDDWRICCHEAGHAIAATKLKIPLDKITRGEGTAGEVQPTHDADDFYEKQIWADYQIFYAAGAAAERIVFGSEKRMFDEIVDPFRDDKEIHSKLELQGRENLFETDIVRAISCLGNLNGKKAIEGVAALLKQRRDQDGKVGEITQEEAAEIFGDRQWWN
jgi:hypothetical protein